MAENLSFAQEVTNLMYSPHGSSLNTCLQCGTCSGSCPAVEFMDQTPRRLIGMINADLKEDALATNTAWACASCYHCTVRCPAKIDIAGVMYAVKRYAMQHKTYSEDLVNPTFYRAFKKTVDVNGRSYEPLLAPSYIFNLGVKGFFLEVQGATKLMLKGRIPVLPSRIKDQKKFQRMIKTIPTKEELL
ncbi:MAG: hypothetical protein DRI32_05240 [Chloroflexi bacterium]|nr:MAG: hypothetical protein DRI32_05240 [Chloroflexota bacterium]